MRQNESRRARRRLLSARHEYASFSVTHFKLGRRFSSRRPRDTSLAILMFWAMGRRPIGHRQNCRDFERSIPGLESPKSTFLSGFNSGRLFSKRREKKRANFGPIERDVRVLPGAQVGLHHRWNSLWRRVLRPRPPQLQGHSQVWRRRRGRRPRSTGRLPGSGTARARGARSTSRWPTWRSSNPPPKAARLCVLDYRARLQAHIDQRDPSADASAERSVGGGDAGGRSMVPVSHLFAIKRRASQKLIAAPTVVETRSASEMARCTTFCAAPYRSSTETVRKIIAVV